MVPSEERATVWKHLFSSSLHIAPDVSPHTVSFWWNYKHFNVSRYLKETIIIVLHLYIVHCTIMNLLKLNSSGLLLIVIVIRSAADTDKWFFLIRLFTSISPSPLKAPLPPRLETQDWSHTTCDRGTYSLPGTPWKDQRSVFTAAGLLRSGGRPEAGGPALWGWDTIRVHRHHNDEGHDSPQSYTPSREKACYCGRSKEPSLLLKYRNEKGRMSWNNLAFVFH